jgi:hypothetical protein
MSTSNYRGHQPAHVLSSFSAGRRRIGSYGVMGWISGKNYSTMTRPTDLTTTIDPGFITGFTDAEGCFMINISSCKRLNTG